LAPARKSLRRELQENKTMRLILLILVIILLVGALPAWPYSAGWGYYPSGGLGLVLVILLVMALLGVV
jgi:membrane protein YdbS with pleckstrin-like domain